MKYDPSNRPEVVLGTSRTRVLRIMLWVVVVQAVLFALWVTFIVIKFRNNADPGIVQVRNLLLGLLLPAAVLLLVTSSLALRFSSRRNATFRMLTTFSGGLLVMVAAIIRGGPIGVTLTIYGLALVALAFWPDKSAKAENAVDPHSGPKP